MPRNGIEPLTRGFSKQQEIPGFAEEKATSQPAVLGDCKASDPDAALRTAIKVALDAGDFDRVRKLVAVLESAPPAAPVVRLADRRR